MGALRLVLSLSLAVVLAVGARAQGGEPAPETPKPAEGANPQPAAAGKYSFSAQRLDFGEFKAPRLVNERVYVTGLADSDRLGAEVLRYTDGVRVGVANALDTSNRRFFEVTVVPTVFDPGSYSDTVVVKVNGTEAARIPLSFTVRDHASKEYLRTLTIYAKERDQFTTNELDPVSRSLKNFPDLKYKVELRFLHEGEHQAEMDRRLQEAELAGSRVQGSGYPVLFLGPALLGRGESEVSLVLQQALFGQDFGKPKPVCFIHVTTNIRPQDIREQHLAKFKSMTQGQVWIVRGLTQELAQRAQFRQGNEYLLDLPLQNGQRNIALQGRVATDLDAHLATVLTGTAPQPGPGPGTAPNANVGGAGNEMRGNEFVSSNTSVTPGGAAPAGSQPAATPATDKSGDGAATAMWPFWIISGVLLFGLAYLLMAVKRQQEVITRQSQLIEAVSRRMGAVDERADH